MSPEAGKEKYICPRRKKCVSLQQIMKTPIATLTTDWGTEGFFAGMVKGELMRLVEGVQVVDISHRLEAYNTVAASFIVRHGCMGFPEGTVHLIDVDSSAPFVAVRSHGQYYLCSDNGLPALVFGDRIEEACHLPVKEGVFNNFAAYNLFVPVAAQLLKGARLDDIGPRCTQLLQRPLTDYLQQDDYYHLYVHYVDNYGNAYLGMSYAEFERLRAGRSFELQVKEMTVSHFSSSYYEGKNNNDPRLRLTVSATGQLELTLQRRSLAQLAGLRVNSSVLLRFKN